MKLTNEQIYNYALSLDVIFIDQKLPVKVNFYLQKNKNTLLNLAKDIEQIRMGIIKTYGVQESDTTTYIIPSENMEVATKELSELLKIEQEVEIHQIDIEEFPNDLTLTQEQMEALMFMIK